MTVFLERFVLAILAALAVLLAVKNPMGFSVTVRVIGVVSIFILAGIAAFFVEKIRHKTKTSGTRATGTAISGDVSSEAGGVAAGHTATSGDVSAKTGGVAVGHHAQIHAINMGAPHTPLKEEKHVSLPGETRIYEFQVRVGDFWQAPDPHNRYVIAVDNISKSDSTSFGLGGHVGDYVADISVKTGGGVVYGGNLTTCLKVNTYRVPEVFGSEFARYSLYNYWPDLNSDYFSSFVLYITHINVLGSIVTMQACFTGCRQPLLTFPRR